MTKDTLNNIDPKRTKVIACATVMEEMQPFLPSEMSREVLEFGLHSDPEKLRKALQSAIDLSGPAAETILLGYGLCSRAVTGLKSATRTLVIPKIDDCIGIFLGSSEEYNAQHRNEPATFNKTKGWIEAGKKKQKPHSEQHKAMEKLYGKKKV